MERLPYANVVSLVHSWLKRDNVSPAAKGQRR
jgi:hypothetical protein